MIELGFGCVQIGMPYGNKSNSELISEVLAHQLLREAVGSGIRFFDTAPGYGMSETRIGNSGITSNSELQFATKIPAVLPELWQNTSAYIKFVSETILQSRSSMKIDRLRLLQFHQCDLAFLESKSFNEVCRFLNEKDWINCLGVSVYSLQQAELAAQNPSIRYLQVPVNLVDIQFLTEIQRQNISLISRSTFLQGVLVTAIA